MSEFETYAPATFYGYVPPANVIEGLYTYVKQGYREGSDYSYLVVSDVDGRIGWKILPEDFWDDGRLYACRLHYLKRKGKSGMRKSGRYARNTEELEGLFDHIRARVANNQRI